MSLVIAIITVACGMFMEQYLMIEHGAPYVVLGVFAGMFTCLAYSWREI